MTNHLYDNLMTNVASGDVFAHLTDGRQYSYLDVANESARYANVLVSLGVQPGDRVTVQVQKSIDAVMLYLACARAGAVFQPLNTAYTEREVAYFLDNARPALMVCDPAQQAQTQSLTDQRGIKLQTLGASTDEAGSAGSLSDAAKRADSSFTNIPRASSDLAAILYTSGTTGKPKGAMLTHGNLLSNAQVLAEYWQFSKEDVLLHALPIFHTHGLFVAINTIVVAGASLIWLPAFDVDAIIDQLPRSTSMMGVPTFYTRLLNDPRLNPDLVSHMRLFTSGSAPLLAETHVQFEQRTGQRILERYGMTETNMSTSNPYHGERRAGTVGFPLPGVEIRVVDPQDNTVLDPGKTGMIEVRGANVFSGYWEMPEKTREDFREDGFFITGDLGFVDTEGYVNLVGRGKDLIISGGFNVYPKEVELVLDELPGVLESAVIGISHSDFGEAVTAVLVPDGDKVPSEEQVMLAIRDKLAKFKQPKKLHFVSELPRNTMGKVQKNLLRERFS